jgi:hypothetical protein
MKRAFIHMFTLLLLVTFAQAEFRRVEMTVFGMD